MVEAVKEKTETKLDIYERLDAIFNGNGTMKEKLPRAEKAIMSDDSLTNWGFGDDTIGYGEEVTASRVFLKEITPVGFELISIMYKCKVAQHEYTHEEKEAMVESGRYYSMYRVPDYTRIRVAGSEKLVAVYRLTYNLRDKIHRVVKNDKELKFRESNMRNMFASHNPKTLVKKIDNLNKELGYDHFEDGSEGMYETMFDKFSAIGGEYNKEMARFLERFMFMNKAELMYKSGLPDNFVSSYISDLSNLLKGCRMSLRTHNNKATKPHQVLGIPKNIYKLVQNGTVGYRRLCEWSYYMLDLTEAEITSACTKIFGMYKYVLEFDKQYDLERVGHVMKHEPEALLRLENKTTAKRAKEDLQNSECAYIAQFLGVPLKQVIEFGYYRLEVEQGFKCYSGWNMSSIYRDYLVMSKQLHARKNNFPRNLKTQHDIFARNVEFLKDQILMEEFKKNKDRMIPWTQVKIRGAKFIMVAPESLEDLTIEGSRMRHCVASYAKQVAEGHTNILFMRDKEDPETSLVTVEVKPDHRLNEDGEVTYTVWQAKQADNVRITPEQDKYLRKWADKLGFSVSGYL